MKFARTVAEVADASTPLTYKPSWHDGDCDDDFEAPTNSRKKRKKKKAKKRHTWPSIWLPFSKVPVTDCSSMEPLGVRHAKSAGDGLNPPFVGQEQEIQSDASSDDEPLTRKLDNLRFLIRKATTQGQEQELALRNDVKGVTQTQSQALSDATFSGGMLFGSGHHEREAGSSRSRRRRQSVSRKVRFQARHEADVKADEDEVLQDDPIEEFSDDTAPARGAAVLSTKSFMRERPTTPSRRWHLPSSNLRMGQGSVASPRVRAIAMGSISSGGGHGRGHAVARASAPVRAVGAVDRVRPSRAQLWDAASAGGYRLLASQISGVAQASASGRPAVSVD